MQNDWEIKARSRTCTATGREFADGEPFMTLLFREADGFRREDLSIEAYESRNDNIRPFSFWKSTYEAPPPPEPETLPKQSAEDLLRRYIDEDAPATANARYILALMLERKKTLRHADTQETDSGRLLIYEHAKTGEIFLIPDPRLHLDQIESIQQEVAELLGKPKPTENPEPHPESTTPAEAADSSDSPEPVAESPRPS